VNVIVVVSDTLRRDCLPCYGATDVIAPNIAAFADQSLVFDNCYAGSFPTVPARADLMTGRYTFTYMRWEPLPPSEITLSALLGEAGYVTCGVADTPFLLRNGYGLDRGFMDFHWIRGQRAGLEREDFNRERLREEDHCAPRTFATAMRWLEWHHTEPFFLYIDTWDPHEPWDPPSHYVRPYLPNYDGHQVTPCYWDWEDEGYTRKDLEVARACYRGEISMVDSWFGRLLRKIEQLNLMSSTAIVLLSDHGFYFGEHGVFGKSRFRAHKGVRGADTLIGAKWRSPLHQEITRVPLLARVPSTRPGRTPAMVSLPDLMPTILDLTSNTVPDTVQGKSLSPTLLNRDARIHEMVVTSAPLLETEGMLTRAVDDGVREVREVSPSTITNGEWDLLYAEAGESSELFRTVEDPGHHTNLIEGNGAVAEHLRHDFADWLHSMGTDPGLLVTRQSL